MAKKVKKNEGMWQVAFTIILTATVLTALLVFGLLNDNGMVATEFETNTKINGVNVSGMDKTEASNLISAKMLGSKKEIEIALKHEDKIWNLSGDDFESKSDIFPAVEEIYNSARSGPAVEKISRARKLKNEGINHDLSYRYILGDFDKKIDAIAEEINCDAVHPSVNFDPSKEGEAMFTLSSGVCGRMVDKDMLYERIDDAFRAGTKISVDIPIRQVDFTQATPDLLANTALRAKFSTSYASSAEGRKNNVNRALADFNGMVVAPNEEVSFNNITGDKTPEKGYMKANIILNGIYVEEYGGGACQASTTLYNAMLLAGMEILEVHPHSLPVSYVPLAFDAMISEGYADFIFKNTTEHPIYIKTYGDESNAYVEVYGEPFDAGFEIRRRAEFIETIPHDGDMIIKDEKGEYADKVTYAGEYYRIKKPQEGYHSKAYLQYYQDGELTSEKLIRDEIYHPQRGIIVEGTETLGEGMVIPENEIKIIPPQENVKINETSVKKKIGIESPSNLNP